MTILAAIISPVLRLYMLLIFMRVLLSWVNVNPHSPGIQHPLVQLLNRITDPVIVPLRRIIPPIGGTVDIVPVVALLLLEIGRWLLVALVSGI
ncbi:YggT family protein [Chloroflexota bacterium]